jgi:Ser/Thr protein kinase RdoA (MazF antagonist)
VSGARWRAEEHPLVVATLRERYGLTVHSLERLHRESVNLVFRAVTDQGTALVKRLGRPAEPGWLAFQAAVLSALCDRGFPVQPLWPARDGETTVTAGEQLWQVRPYAQGRAFRAGDAHDVEAAARALAQLHRAPVEALVPAGVSAGAVSPTDDLVLWLWDDGAAHAALEELVRRIAPATLADAVLPHYREAFTRARRQLGPAAYQSLGRVLTHGEFVGSNLLLGDRDVCSVMDWDAVQVRPRVYDLARACLFMARKARGSIQLHEDLSELFLRTATSDAPLSEAERDALIPILELYFVPSPAYLSVMAELAPADVPWYLDWSAKGAAQVRGLLSPVTERLATAV